MQSKIWLNHCFCQSVLFLFHIFIFAVMYFSHWKKRRDFIASILFYIFVAIPLCISVICSNPSYCLLKPRNTLCHISIGVYDITNRDPKSVLKNVIKKKQVIIALLKYVYALRLFFTLNYEFNMHFYHA